MGNSNQSKKAGRLGEAENFMISGKKAKRDHDKALRCYENAAKKLRGVIPATQESLGMLVKCLESMGAIAENEGYHTQSAKYWEEAGKRITNNNEDPNSQAVQFYRKASVAYRTSGQVKKSAESLLKAAKYCEDVNETLENVKSACEIVSDEEKLTSVREIFQKSVDIAISHNHFDLAIELLEMQSEMYKKAGDDYAPSLHQAIAGIIVILIYIHQRKRAYKCLTDFEQNTSLFHGSEQRDFCWDVLRASLACEEKSLEPCFKKFGIYLVGNVSRLGRKMNFEELDPIEEDGLTSSAFEELDLREDIKETDKVDGEGVPDLF